MIIDEFSLDEIHLIVFYWMEAIPHSGEVTKTCDKIKKLIRKYDFRTLLEPDGKIPGFVGDNHLPVAATFMLLLYLSNSCCNLSGKDRIEEELFPEKPTRRLQTNERIRSAP